MANNIKFRQDLEDFIRDRIEESYKIVSNKNTYKKLNSKYKELEKHFIEMLKEKTIKEQYYIIRDIRMELNSQELQEAYLIGFRDNSKIINNEI